MLTQDWTNVKLEAAKEVCMYCADLKTKDSDGLRLAAELLEAAAK